MSNSSEVALERATSQDATLLSNLLELYIHELSCAFPHLEIGEDGRFGYRRLPLYWSEPDRRFAFVIKVEGRVAGFSPTRSWDTPIFEKRLRVTHEMFC